MSATLSLAAVDQLSNSEIEYYLQEHNIDIDSNELRNRLIAIFTMYNQTVINPDAKIKLKRSDLKYVYNKMFKTYYLMPSDYLNMNACAQNIPIGIPRSDIIKMLIDAEYKYPFKNLSEYGAPVRNLGEGVYGLVIQTRLQSGTTYAIKFLNKFDEITVDTYREIVSISYLNHPNIVKILDIGIISNDDKNAYRRYTVDLNDFKMFIVMEVANSNLKDIMDINPRLNATDRIKFGYQIASAILHYTNHNIINRDLKPSNVLIDKNGDAIVSDFGLARINYCPNNTRVLTGDLYTLWYRPPEILLGDVNYGSAAEVWAYGCILYEIFTGDVLFKAYAEDNMVNLIYKTLGTPNTRSWPDGKNLPRWSAFNQLKYSGTPNKFNQIRVPGAGELLKRIFVYDPAKRPTMYDIVMDPLFNRIRNGCIIDLPCAETLNYRKYYANAKSADRERIIRNLELLMTKYVINSLSVFALAVHLIDDYQEKVSAPETDLDLVAFGCMSLATKMLGHYINYNLSTQYQPAEVRNYETKIAQKLQWKLYPSTIMDYYYAYGRFYTSQTKEQVGEAIKKVITSDLPFYIEADQLALGCFAIYSPTFHNEELLIYPSYVKTKIAEVVNQ